jgi:hypothetical protein
MNLSISAAWTPRFEGSCNIDDYIGTIMDITERKRGEDTLRTAQADLIVRHG